MALTITLNSTQSPAVGQYTYLTATNAAATWSTNPLVVQSDPLGISGTNLTVDASSNLKVNPDGHTVTSADIGRYVQVITTGTGAAFTIGSYLVTSVVTGTTSTQRLVLASSPAATSSAGAKWSLTSANCDSVSVTDASDCAVGLYNGDTPGTVTILDTVNNVTATVSIAGSVAKRVATGTTWYVGNGGCENPAAPFPTAGYPTTGSAVPVLYQLVAHNANGATLGVNASAVNMGNVPASSSFLTSYTALRVLTVNNWNAASGSITLNWPVDPNATSYDLLRSTNGTTWGSVTTGNTTGTYTDTNASTGAYALPGTNNTSGGSDSNNGTSAATPFLTLSHAMSVASAGDQIIINPGAFVVDTGLVTCKDGVNIVFGAGAQCFSSYSPSNSSHAAYRAPSNADIINPNFTTGTFGQIALGCLSGDSPTIDVHIYSSTVMGNTNAIRFGAAGCSAYVNGGFFSSEHGTLGIISTSANTVVNVERVACYAKGAFQTTGGSTVACLFQAGYFCARDSQFISNIDSQNLPSWKSYAINPSGGISGRLVNCTLYGVSQELLSNGVLLMNNTQIDPVKNALSTLANVTTINQGTYQPNPLQVPPASNVSTGYVYAGGALTGSASSGGSGGTTATAPNVDGRFF